MKKLCFFTFGLLFFAFSAFPSFAASQGLHVVAYGDDEISIVNCPLNPLPTPTDLPPTPPAVIPTPTPIPPDCIRGAYYPGLFGSITDPGVDPHFTLTIDYGDGSTSQPIAIDGNDIPYLPSESHLYTARGEYPVLVTVTDTNGASTTVSAGTAVIDNPPSITAPQGGSVISGGARYTEIGPSGTVVMSGVQYTEQGAFTDPNTDASSWTGWVDYGLGRTPLDINQQDHTFPFSYSFTNPGWNSLTIYIQDDFGQWVQKTVLYYVAKSNQAPSVAPLSDVTLNEGDTLSQSGSFSDADSSSWTASVDYGDGTGPQLLALSGNTFSLSHVYVTPGTYTTTVSVIDDQNAVGLATFQVTVNDVVPTLSLSFSPNGENGWFVTNPATGTVTATTLTTGSTTVSAVTCTGANVSNVTGLGTHTASATLSVATQGTTTVSCMAVDNLNANSQSQQISVLLDSLKPTCTTSANPSVLKPANNKLVPVHITLNPQDTISGLPTSPFVLSSLTSNETITTDDYPGFTIGTAALDGQLRAKRNGTSKQGRIYTLTYQVTNDAGLTNTCQTTVTAPH